MIFFNKMMHFNNTVLQFAIVMLYYSGINILEVL